MMGSAALMDPIGIRRRKHRIKKRRSFLVDFLFYSSPYDYRLLRFVYLMPCGGVVAYLLWQMLFVRIEVFDLEAEVNLALKWMFVSVIAFSFVWSPVFRCVCVSCAFMFLGCEGQTMLSVVIFRELLAGPISNVGKNLEGAHDSIACHLQLAEHISKETVKLRYQPYHDILPDLVAGSADTKKVLAHLNEAYNPLRMDWEEEDERKQLEDELARFEALRRLSKTLDPERRYDVDLDDKFDADHLRPRPLNKQNATEREKTLYSRFKSKFARGLAKKVDLRCGDIFSSAALLCYDKWKDLKSRCFSFRWFGWSIPALNNYICPKFEVLNFCQIFNYEEVQNRLCDPSMEMIDLIPADFDKNVLQAEQSNLRLLEELKVSIHLKLVEQPRFLRLNGLKGIRLRIKLQIAWLMYAVLTIAIILKALFVLMVYRAFMLAYEQTGLFLNDIAVRNNYTTVYFWYLEERRKEEGMLHLTPLRRYEIVRNNLASPISRPSSAEIYAAAIPFVKFLFVAAAVALTVFADYGYYLLMSQVRQYGDSSVKVEGKHTLYLKVNGTGEVSQMFRTILKDFNKTQILNETIDNRHCLVNPSPPDYAEYAKTLGVPLLAMLLLQVIFSFVISRAKDFVVFAFFFPQRQKCRILNLYNRLLRERGAFMKMARGRIRYRVKINALRRITMKWTDRFLLWRIFDACCPTVNCILCDDSGRAKTMVFCKKEKCRVPYCKDCWSNLGEMCYACLAKKGYVTTEHTQFRAE